MLGYSDGSSEGIGVAPTTDMEILDYFPTNGKVIIEDTVYRYTGKSDPGITNPIFSVADMVGPYPSNGTQQDTDVGYIVFYHYWSDIQFSSAYVGKNWLVCFGQNNKVLANGTTYSSQRGYNSTVWYVDDVGYVTPDTADKFYITMGLIGVSALSGDSLSHYENTLCHLYTSERLKVTSFYANNTEPSITVKDMLKKVCSMVGIEYSFSGDRTASVDTTPTGEQV